MRTATFALALFAAAATFAAAGADLRLKPDEKGAFAGRWTRDYDTAVALSRKAGLPLLLKFSKGDRDGWCKLMEEKVFATEAFAKWADERVVLVEVDLSQDSGAAPDDGGDRSAKLAEEHGVADYPTCVVKNADGKELGRIGAFPDPTVERFTAVFEGLVGSMPEKETPVAGSDAVTEEEMDQWLRGHLTAPQQRAYREKLTDAERAEFPSLAFAGRDVEAARERLVQERAKFVEEMRKELAELAESDPDAAKERKEKALAELQQLDDSHAARLHEIKAIYDRKSARLKELIGKLD